MVFQSKIQKKSASLLEMCAKKPRELRKCYFILLSLATYERIMDASKDGHLVRPVSTVVEYNSIPILATIGYCCV